MTEARYEDRAAHGSRGGVRLESPRLKALIRAVASSPRGGLRAEWAALVRKGVPLVERVPGDRTSRRVTFVWRPKGLVDRPAIYTPLANPLRGEMELLPAGDTGA